MHDPSGRRGSVLATILDRDIPTLHLRRAMVSVDSLTLALSVLEEMNSSRSALTSAVSASMLQFFCSDSVPVSVRGDNDVRVCSSKEDYFRRNRLSKNEETEMVILKSNPSVSIEQVQTKTLSWFVYELNYSLLDAANSSNNTMDEIQRKLQKDLNTKIMNGVFDSYLLIRTGLNLRTSPVNQEIEVFAEESTGTIPESNARLTVLQASGISLFGFTLLFNICLQLIIMRRKSKRVRKIQDVTSWDGYSESTRSQNNCTYTNDNLQLSQDKNYDETHRSSPIFRLDRSHVSSTSGKVRSLMTDLAYSDSEDSSFIVCQQQGTEKTLILLWRDFTSLQRRLAPPVDLDESIASSNETNSDDDIESAPTMRRCYQKPSSASESAYFSSPSRGTMYDSDDFTKSPVIIHYGSNISHSRNVDNIMLPNRLGQRLSADTRNENDEATTSSVEDLHELSKLSIVSSRKVLFERRQHDSMDVKNESKPNQSLDNVLVGTANKETVEMLRKPTVNSHTIASSVGETNSMDADDDGSNDGIALVNRDSKTFQKLRDIYSSPGNTNLHATDFEGDEKDEDNEYLEAYGIVLPCYEFNGRAIDEPKVFLGGIDRDRHKDTREHFKRAPSETSASIRDRAEKLDTPSSENNRCYSDDDDQSSEFTRPLPTEPPGCIMVGEGGSYAPQSPTKSLSSASTSEWFTGQGQILPQEFPVSPDGSLTSYKDDEEDSVLNLYSMASF